MMKPQGTRPVIWSRLKLLALVRMVVVSCMAASASNAPRPQSGSYSPGFTNGADTRTLLEPVTETVLKDLNSLLHNTLPSQPAHNTKTNPVDETLSSAPEALASSNLHPSVNSANPELVPRSQLATARKLRKLRQFGESKTLLSSLLHDPECPEPIKRSSLLELALGAQEEHDLVRAQQIFSQYLAQWPQDMGVPEILLRQGLLYREMGAPRLAISKFYSVLTAALVLKNDSFDYYQRLVLQAQTEIGETYYLDGKFEDAAASFKQVLKLDDKGLNRAAVQFKLLRCLSKMEKNQELVGLCNEFLGKFEDSHDVPEVRFMLASAYKRLGENPNSLQQVLLLLQEQRMNSNASPALLSMWQQRTGNEIANQLYREGDFLRALDIYQALAKLDTNPAWQIPVHYQIGLVFERLDQPSKALEAYARILSLENELGRESSPSLKAVLDMARWRTSFIEWSTRTAALTRDFKPAIAPEALAAKSSSGN